MTAFDLTWEKIFSSRSWGRYPSESIVRAVMRALGGAKDRAQIRILDLGCGGGANTWFLAREGFSTFAIDGSASAIAQTRELLARDSLGAELQVGDFSSLPQADGSFDAVIDANAIQHNCLSDIERIYREVFRVLKPGGFFVANCLSDQTSGSESAEQVEPGTYRNFTRGPITPDVLAHFFELGELKNLLSSYEEVTIDHLLRTEGRERLGQWLVTARKGPR